MPKKKCCCVNVRSGSYIAIPCRYFYKRSYIGEQTYYAHYEGNVENPFGGFGGGQGNLIGPFRFVNGNSVFDSTRKIRYMLRGAGGGAGGPQIKRNFPGFEQIVPFQYSKGGNGAYTEFETLANQDHVIRGGLGGSGGINNWYVGDIADPNPSKHKRQGGQGVYVDANGGDAAFISSGVGWAIQHPPLAVAGGGGGGSFFWNDRIAGSGNDQPQPEDTAQIGPRNGGNAGIAIAEKGQDGWSNIQNISTGGGGAATSTAGGSAGTDIIITSANIYPTAGTNLLGGRGQRFRFEEVNNVFTYIGRGGGGGGGLFGGGGGAFSGGGGGGSSTKGNSYSFVSSNNFSANHCNPYLEKDTGIGGNRNQSLFTLNGGYGSVTQYYIEGFCPCDPSKNDIPEPMFICLNQEQYEYVINELGPPPDIGFDEGDLNGLFVYEGEEYILLGACETDCESAYVIEEDASLESIRWEIRKEIFGEGGSSSPPPCCSQIICRPLCPLEGVNCANCGCSDVAEILSCCQTEGKPDTYTGIYNGWLYSCVKSNQNWIIPGVDAPNITEVCISPSNSICSQEPKECEVSVSEPPGKCLDPACSNCKLSITVTGDLTWYDYCFTEDPNIPDCIEKQLTVNHTFDIPTSGSFFINKLLPSCVNTDFLTQTYIIFIDISVNRAAEIEEPVLEVEFDCASPNNGSVNIGMWEICGAKVNVEGEGAYLSTIAEKFNFLLGGRVTVRDLTGGKFYVGCGGQFPTRSEETVTNGRLKITYYGMHPYFIACGNVSVVISVAPCPSTSITTYFESSSLLDGWNMNTLALTPCPCVPVFPNNPDAKSEFLCTNCGTSPAIIGPCPSQPLTVTGNIYSI
jgi:hypothetical protein